MGEFTTMCDVDGDDRDDGDEYGEIHALAQVRNARSCRYANIVLVRLKCLIPLILSISNV